jgi:hypothetical protein
VTDVLDDELFALTRELAALAAGLCQDAGIQVEVADAPWSWDPMRRVITVSSETLADEGPDYCAGVLAIEVGHFFLTRHESFEVAFPSRKGGLAVIDALEQGRTSLWMCERYPGVEPWIDRAAQSAGRVHPKAPAFLQFCAGCRVEAAWGFAPFGGRADPRVVEALNRTREARMAYADLAPPPLLDPADHPDLRQRYRLEVRPALLTPGWMPVPTEQLIQLYAIEALRHAEATVLPVAEELLDDDLSRIERSLSNDSAAAAAARRALEEGKGISDLVEKLLRDSPPARRSARHRRLARRLLERMLSGALPKRMLGRSGEAIPGDGSGHLPPLSLPPLQVQWQPPTDYDRAFESVADQVDDLVRQLDEILRPRKRLRERGGYPSGHKVDLRRLMAFEADPRLYDELWVRASIPDRREVVIGLLVDLSGSMSGDKVHAAQLGTILLAETLARLQVRFAVHGFQDVLVPLCDYHQDFDGRARDAIAQIPMEVRGCRPEGNNKPAYNDDGPCLLECAELLRAEPASDRLLIVVSDGRPAGRRSNESDLRDAVAQLTSNDKEMELLALGLGPGTSHVSEYYPAAEADVPLAEFAERIGALIRTAVLGEDL